MSFVKAEVKEKKVNHVNMLYVFITLYYSPGYSSAPESVDQKGQKQAFFLLCQ